MLLQLAMEPSQQKCVYLSLFNRVCCKSKLILNCPWFSLTCMFQVSDPRIATLRKTRFSFFSNDNLSHAVRCAFQVSILPNVIWCMRTLASCSCN